MKHKFNSTFSDTTDAVRRFFVSKGYTAVETPVIITSPLPEPHIDAVETAGGYFRTSPEIHMKILLAEGYQNIFEIGPCRRKHEKGRFHREEFTMLEWYQNEADYRDLIGFTREMMLYLCEKICKKTKVSFHGNIIDFNADWEIISLNDLFAEFANTTAQLALEQGEYEELLVSVIEPELPKGKPVIVKDYPAGLAALAKLKNNDKSLCERWELYLGGIEIANTYTELTDAQEHYERFAKFAAQRQSAGVPPYQVDPGFIKALEKGIPDSAGCAMGIDRLVMILTDADSI